MRHALLAVLAFLGILSVWFQWIGWLGGAAFAWWRWDWRIAVAWLVCGYFVCGWLTDGIAWLCERVDPDRL